MLHWVAALMLQRCFEIMLEVPGVAWTMAHVLLSRTFTSRARQGHSGIVGTSIDPDEAMTPVWLFQEPIFPPMARMVIACI